MVLYKYTKSLEMYGNNLSGNTHVRKKHTNNSNITFFIGYINNSVINSRYILIRTCVLSEKLRTSIQRGKWKCQLCHIHCARPCPHR